MNEHIEILIEWTWIKIPKTWVADCLYPSPSNQVLLAKSLVMKEGFCSSWIPILCCNIIKHEVILDFDILFYFIHHIVFSFCLFFFFFRSVSRFSPGFLTTFLNQNVVYFYLLNNQLEKTYSYQSLKCVVGNFEIGLESDYFRSQSCVCTWLQNTSSLWALSLL